MSSYYISLVLIFLLMNFLPLVGAYYFARFLNRGGYSELILLTLLTYFAEVIFAYGVPGVLGYLNYMGCGITGAVIGVSLCFFGKYAKPVKSASFSFTERLFAALFITALLLRFYWASMMHSGTDTYLYHLYYPAMWLAEGRIFPVSIAGMAHEYFPTYGEFLYGWLMLPVGDASFAIFLQLLSLVMACSAVLALSKAFGFKRTDGLVAVNFMVFASIISEISILGYTDVLNGAFLLAGFALMIIGALRNDKKFAIISGVALGCSASIKYSGLLLTPVLAFMCLIVFLSFRRKLWRYSLFLAGSATAAALPAYLGNWVKTGNPFYPVKVVLAGIPIFSSGIDFERSATGFSSKTWSSFVNSNIWDMNLATGILYVILPFAVITLFVFYRKFLKKQMIFLFLALMIIVLSVIQICLYPAMAQARQIIPVLMLAVPLFIPLINVVNVVVVRKKLYGRVISVFAAIILCICLSYTQQHSDFVRQWILVTALTLTFVFWPDKMFRRYSMGVIIIFVLSLPYLFQVRLNSKNMYNYILAGSHGGKCVKIVWDDFNRNSKPVNIASIGSWYNFMFMADMPGNKVVYIPINKKNSTHPHEFDSYTEIRNNPVPFGEWYKRLKKQKIDYLVINSGCSDGFMTNDYQEFRWAKAHPEHFEKLVDNGKVFFFRLRE